MLVIVVIGLAVTLFLLWQQVRGLKERVEWLELHGVAGAYPEEVRQPAVVVQSSEYEIEPIPPTRARLVEPAIEDDPSALGPDISDRPLEEATADRTDWRDRLSFEDIFGRRLPIWAGGITLAIAGLLIVKYSIDAGLLSPLVRVLGGLAFGTMLIAAAELAYRFEDRVGDERVRQALAGAGIATLYGAVLVAANVYGLIGNGLAFVGMAAITAMALGLSLRFGAPSAMLGLAGGFAAPALVGSDDPSVALLTGYLALTIGALSLVSRRQEWLWLRAAALAGGFAWTAFLVASGALDEAGSIPVGLLMLAVGFAFPALRRGGVDDRIQWITGIMAAGQVAALVASGGFTPLHWGLFGLLSAATIWLSRRSPAHAHLPAVGLAVTLMLMLAWPTPPGWSFALVAMGAVALYGAWAIGRLWTVDGSIVEAGSLAALGLGVMFIPWVHFGAVANPALLGGVGVAASLIPGIGAWFGWTHDARHGDARFATLVMATAGVLAGAALNALAPWAVAPAFALLAIALERVLTASGDARLKGGVIVAGLGSFFALFGGDLRDWARLFGEESDASLFAAARWALVSGVLAWLARSRLPRKATLAFQVFAALTAYGALAQLIGGAPLATAAAALTATVCVLGAYKLVRHWRTAAITLLCLTAIWMIKPIGAWLATAADSLAGHPYLATPLDSQALVWRLALPAALLMVTLAVAAHRMTPAIRRAMQITVVAAIAVASHLLFKQVFAITTADRFIVYGVAERALWEALLLGGGAVAWRKGHRLAAQLHAGATLTHAAVYSMLWHNPLWSEQWVGPWPIANLLLVAYLPPLAALWLLGRIGLDNAIAERARKVAPAIPIALLAFSTVRQAVEGAILTNPGVTSIEDIGRSVVAVLLGIGFLLWGIAHNARDWRIISLGVMVAAVGKVFLVDAAGLDGLARIGSFLALGLSLIGIGWLYSRFLRKDRA